MPYSYINGISSAPVIPAVVGAVKKAVDNVEGVPISKGTLILYNVHFLDLAIL